MLLNDLICLSYKIITSVNVSKYISTRKRNELYINNFMKERIYCKSSDSHKILQRTIQFYNISN